MPLPRFRLRSFLIAVAAIAVILAVAIWGVQMKRRSDSYRQRAAYHAQLEAINRQEGQRLAQLADRWEEETRWKGVTGTDLKRIGLDESQIQRVRERFDEEVYWARSNRLESAERAKQAAYHARMRDMYSRATRYPWLTVESDPPVPK